MSVYGRFGLFAGRQRDREQIVRLTSGISLPTGMMERGYIRYRAKQFGMK